MGQSHSRGLDSTLPLPAGAAPVSVYRSVAFKRFRQYSANAGGEGVSQGKLGLYETQGYYMSIYLTHTDSMAQSPCKHAAAAIQVTAAAMQRERYVIHNIYNRGGDM